MTIFSFEFDEDEIVDAFTCESKSEYCNITYDRVWAVREAIYEKTTVGALMERTGIKDISTLEGIFALKNEGWGEDTTLYRADFIAVSKYTKDEIDEFDACVEANAWASGELYVLEGEQALEEWAQGLEGHYRGHNVKFQLRAHIWADEIGKILKSAGGFMEWVERDLASTNKLKADLIINAEIGLRDSFSPENLTLRKYADGWGLFSPEASDEEIAAGDYELLSKYTKICAEEDYEEAFEIWVNEPNKYRK